MSAGTLRKAAARIRQFANNATDGPWAWEATGQQDNSWALGTVVDEGGDDLSGDITDHDGPTEVVDAVCYQDDGNLSDAAYIALLHPPVGRAVAELLEASAVRWEQLERHNATTSNGGDYPEVPDESMEAATALARWLLGSGDAS